MTACALCVKLDGARLQSTPCWRGHRLEWYIVILILVEIALIVFELLTVAR